MTEQKPAQFRQLIRDIERVLVRVDRVREIERNADNALSDSGEALADAEKRLPVQRRSMPAAGN